MNIWIVQIVIELKERMDQQMNVGSNERWKIEMLNAMKLA